MEGIAPGADVDHRDTVVLQVSQCSSTDGGPNAPPTYVRVDCDHLQAAGAIGMYLPAHVAQEPAVTLSHSDESVPVGIVQGWDLSAVAVLPLPVVVGEHPGVEHRGQVHLEQGSESLDGQINQGRQVSGLEIADVHVVASRSALKQAWAPILTALGPHY
jgi:hypothetical protein